MLIGKVQCPDTRYEFRVYINKDACKDAMLIESYVTNSDTRRPQPGLLGKLVFRYYHLMTRDTIAYWAVQMALLYIKLVTKDKLVFGNESNDSDALLASLVQHFTRGINELPTV